MELKAVILSVSEEDTRSLEWMLSGHGITFDSFETLPSGEGEASVVIVFLGADYLESGGEAAFGDVRGRFPKAVITVVSALAHEHVIHRYIEWGVWDVLYLPIEKQDFDSLLERVKALLERQELEGRRKTILIVDDEENVRDPCRELLTAAGYEASTASSGDEALKVLAKNRYDLVLSDVKMPEMDGVELLKVIKSSYPDMLVVMITGYATIDTAVECLRYGATDFLHKPFKAADLTSSVNRVFAMQSLARENMVCQEQLREDKVILRRQRYEQEVLAQVMAKLASVFDFDELADSFLHNAYRVVDYARAGIILYCPKPRLTVVSFDEKGETESKLDSEIYDYLPEIMVGDSRKDLEVRMLSSVGIRSRAPSRTLSKPWFLKLEAGERPLGAMLIQTSLDAPLSVSSKAFLSNLGALIVNVAGKLLALQTQEKIQMETMVSSMHSGVILADPEGRIIVMNKAAREMLAIQRENDPSGLKAISERVKIPLDRYVEDLLQTGGSAEFKECRLGKPREAVLNIDLTVIRDEEEKVIGVVTLLRDITELKEIDQMKSEFVSIVSHEIRTPLTTIKNCNSIILNKTAGAVTEHQEHFLKIAQESIDRLTRLVDDLLDLSKIEAGKLNLDSRKLKMEEVLNDAVGTVEHLAEEKNISLEWKAPPASLLLYGDSDRLKQVFINLLQNAVKFSPEKAVVSVAARDVNSNEELPAAVAGRLGEPLTPSIEVRISDQGIGIEEENLESIFSKFQQGDDTLQREMGGIGLGLPISRGIVESHNGAIWAERRPEGGSVFRVILPKDKRAVSRKEERN